MMTKKRMIVGVAAALALAAMVTGCQNFEIQAGVLTKYVGTKVKIPSSITTIGAQAFRGLGITSVSIPSSVTKIEREAFSGCTSLAGVTIPNRVTKIWGDAFARCTSLACVTLLADVALYADSISTSFDGNLRCVYNGNGKQAGTYVKDGDTWKKR